MNNAVTSTRNSSAVRKLTYSALYLIAAMLAGRLVWGLVQFLLAGLRSTTFNLAMFLSGAVTMALPGIILQLVLIPVLVVVMERTNMIPRE